MAVRNWSGLQILLFWLLWPGLIVALAILLNLIEVRSLVGPGRAVALRIQWAGTIASIALAVPVLLTFYWRRGRR